MKTLATDTTASDGLPTLTVNWTQPNNTKSAQVYRSMTQGQIGTLVATLPRPPYVDATALAGTTYWYGIKLQGPNGPYGALSTQFSGFIASAPPAPPSIGNIQLPPAQVGVPYSAQLVASGGTTPYAWSIASGLPPGMTVSQSGAIAGTGTASGSFPFSAKVTDAANQTATKPLSIDVAAANRPPVWQTIPAINFTLGTAGSAPISQYASDPDGDPLTLALESGALPPGVTFSAGRFSYDGLGALASATVTVSADDGK